MCLGGWLTIMYEHLRQLPCNALLPCLPALHGDTHLWPQGQPSHHCCASTLRAPFRVRVTNPRTASAPAFP